jgi:hypothetical protein
MKKKTKVIDGKLTVIRPKARRRSQEPAGGVGIIEEAIVAIRDTLEAGGRLHRVIKKIRGK